MRIKLILAFLLFALGVARIVDWIIYWNQNKQLQLSNYNGFIAKYNERFPSFLRGTLGTLINIVFFAIAALIFIKTKNKFYFVLGIISALLGFWNLFSLM